MAIFTFYLTAVYLEYAQPLPDRCVDLAISFAVNFDGIAITILEAIEGSKSIGNCYLSETIRFFIRTDISR
jgi:hypothetical protein